MKKLRVLLGFVLSVLGYLSVVVFSPWIKAEPQPIEKDLSFKKKPSLREDFTCKVNGQVLRGWFYSRGLVGTYPCIIMSHGFCGTKDGLLEGYALRYIEEGFNVITYDYRYFGDSDGEPRQLYSSAYQLQDLKAVIDYARFRSDVQDEGIFLWGSSAGAHLGILAAVQDQTIAGVIGQCGAYDNLADFNYLKDKVGMGHFLKLFVHAQRDKGRSRLGLSPHRLPAYGREGTTAMFNVEGVYESVSWLLRRSWTFDNSVCARSIFTPQNEDVLSVAHKIMCPVLLQTCLYDGLVSPESHMKLEEILGELVEVKTYPINHFQIYEGENFEKAVLDQLEFMKENV